MGMLYLHLLLLHVELYPGEDLQKMMQMMEMKAHCQCTASDVAYGQMAMPTMTAAGRK